ncbi:MAG: hypothetical protein DRM97_04630 [Thermoprotei archaeon]|nr:MAG: hypothetical protein DRM97_04630 [Thermoprotei archaeon]
MVRPLPIEVPIKGKIVNIEVPRTGYRWRGVVELSLEDGLKVALIMTGSIAQWLSKGELVEVTFHNEPRYIRGEYVGLPDDYELKRIWNGEYILIWPP